MEFHGIPWNFSCHRNWRTSSSMEFHGIQLDCSCHRNWRTPSSMEFHRTYCCYLMEPLVSSIHWILKWDRIPWNLSFQILMKITSNCAGWINFRKLTNTLYLFAISFTNWCFIIDICIIPYAFPVILITYQNIIQNLFSMLIETYFDQKVPWNFLQCSMELFEQHLNNTCGSMEFHGILSRSKVPWNSMELFPYSRVPWNSMEFHGTFNFPPKVPWNSMELFWSSMEFQGIQRNLINFIFQKNIFLNIVFGIWLMIRCYLAKISPKRYILHWFQYRNSHFEHPSVSENGTRSAKIACCYKKFSS